MDVTCSFLPSLLPSLIPSLGQRWLIMYRGRCREAERPLFVVRVALNKDWIYSNSPFLLLLLLFSSSSPIPLLLPPHFYGPWLLPTPIKHYKHKNPQALKSRPGEEEEEEEEERGEYGGEETVGRNILLFTPLNHSIQRRREMEGRIYCLWWASWLRWIAQWNVVGVMSSRSVCMCVNVCVWRTRPRQLTLH